MEKEKQLYFKPPIKQNTYKNKENNNYISQNIQPNYSTIDNIYNTFKTDEYDVIKNIISGNDILNFITKNGETLIHAIISNISLSLNESKIKEIIELLVHKNVSINTMNEFNHTALHMACKKGYYEIINYLLSLGCNKEIIDNDGNAPIHYIIDKIIDDCKNNEYFNYTNAVINNNNLLSNRQIRDINLCIITQLMENMKKGYLLDSFKHLTKIVKLYKYYSFNNVDENNLLNYYSSFKKNVENDIQNYILTQNTTITPEKLNDVINKNILDFNTDIINNYTQKLLNYSEIDETEIINDKLIETIHLKIPSARSWQYV